MAQSATTSPLSAKWREGAAILIAVGAVTLLHFLSSGQFTFLPIIIGVLLLALLLNRRLLIPAVLIVVALIAAATGFLSTDQSAIGKWIAANSAANATVATDQISALAYYAGRSTIAPNVEDRTFFIQHAPDVVVLRGDQVQAVAWENFPTTYQQVFSSGDLNVYQRVVNFSWLPDARETLPVDFLFNQYLPNRSDLRLVGVAVFSGGVHPGDLIRIALTWELRYPPVLPVTVRVSMVDGFDTILWNVSDQYPPDAVPNLWTQHHFTTYHLLPLPIDAPFGTYNLRVGVTVGEGDLGEHTVTTVSIVS